MYLRGNRRWVPLKGMGKFGRGRRLKGKGKGNRERRARKDTIIQTPEAIICNSKILTNVN